MVTPAARREAVAHLKQSYEMSERHARLYDLCKAMTRWVSVLDTCPCPDGDGDRDGGSSLRGACDDA